MSKSFNLIDEPWILVRDLTGHTQEVSLRSALVDAHRWREIRGDIPTQAAAILRLLMAVVIRAFPDTGEDPMDQWGDLWSRGAFDPALIDDYLERYRHRFDLLDETQPFFQTPGLHLASGEFTSLSRLIADVPAGEQFFTTRGPGSFEFLSYAETARWLVHANAFDPSGIKSGAAGDARVKNGKCYPLGQAWCGWLGLIVLEGETLFETILLNANLDLRTAGDSVVWERPALSPGEEGRSGPMGPLDLLTWPSRRLRVRFENGVATGALVCYGDPLHPRNLQALELMSSWRRSSAQEKAHGLPLVMMPREHLPNRAVWRGLAGLLATGLSHGEGLPAPNLNLVALAVDVGHLAPGKVVRARTVGVVYGTQSAVIDEVIDDMLAVRSVVVADKRLRSLAVAAVEDADRMARIMGQFAENLADAAGREGDGYNQAKESAYAAVDLDYRAWLRSLTADSDDLSARARWQTLLVGQAQYMIDTLSSQAGRIAAIGRIKGDRPINTALAQVWARAKLRKELPLAQQYDADLGAVTT